MQALLSKQTALVVPEGQNVEVRRLMPVAGRRNFDPFVLWDHFDIASGGFPDHPHRGFEAITYMLAGGMQHADNLGNRSIVHAGGAQRFTAGRGLVHSEMPEGHASGIQLWINLPRQLKGLPPAYQQVDAEDFPTHKAQGVCVRTLVGEGSPLLLQTAVDYLDVSLDAGSHWSRKVKRGFRGFVYVLHGCICQESHEISAGEAIFVEGVSELFLEARSESRLMWCFGQPHGEPIYQHGPFVD